MDNGVAAGVDGGREPNWRFGSLGPALAAAGARSVRTLLFQMFDCLDKCNPRPVVHLGHGDTSAFACFRTAAVAEDAVTDAARSGAYNSYSPPVGIPEARSAIAEYLSSDLPYKLSPDDIFLTAGCNQAIEAMMAVVAAPGANILLPRPGFPMYEARATFSGLEFKHYNLDPKNGWEVDLDHVQSLVDKNTVAMVVINPNNPCGSIYTLEKLAKIAETARKFGILVIADEVYGHLVFGSRPFVPMGILRDIAPIVTLGSISKRWAVPGWRLGWIAIADPKGVLRKNKVVESIINFLNISTDPATFIQGAIPKIIANTDKGFFTKTINLLRETAEICCGKLKDIECITCPHKPEGSMFVMVKLDLSYLEGINDDVDFCSRLAKEESVVLFPGNGLGMKNWIRITFAVDPALLEDGLERLKSFCRRHAKVDE